MNSPVQVGLTMTSAEMKYLHREYKISLSSSQYLPQLLFYMLCLTTCLGFNLKNSPKKEILKILMNRLITLDCKIAKNLYEVT